MDAFWPIMTVITMWIGLYLGGQNEISKYYDKPYCQTIKVGKDNITKCYKVVEDKEAELK